MFGIYIIKKILNQKMENKGILAKTGKAANTSITCFIWNRYKN